jgi:PHD/YefM family antitoxin component YafN of YafNO toxin-antitoxin module
MYPDRQRQPQKRYLRTRASKTSPDPQHQDTNGTLGSRPLETTKTLPRFSSWFQPNRRYDPQESFFPFPKVTFLIDQPIELKCQICHQASCQIKSDAESPDESTFSLMPCGHAACLQCLEGWFEYQGTCPFCRVDLIYPGCGHRVPVRPLTREGLHLLPRTLPDQGRIPNFCAQCLKETLLSQAEEKLKQAIEGFEATRQRFYHTKAAADKATMLNMKDEFETVLRDEVYLKRLSTWLTSW